MCTKCFNVIYIHQILNLEITVFFHSMQFGLSQAVSTPLTISAYQLLICRVKAMKLPSRTPPSLLGFRVCLRKISGSCGWSSGCSCLSSMLLLFFSLRVSSYLCKSLRVGIRKDCSLRFEEISRKVQTMRNRRLSNN